MNRKFALCIAGTQSGCGKTTITLALIAALRKRNLKVQPFKVGPDFIDPGFHTQIASRESRNLDGWMLEKDYNKRLFARLHGEADVALVEGVMGLFDGYDGLTEAGSTAEMAKWLDIPVILILNARSMARSAAAVVLGFTSFDPALTIGGVIFNQIGGEGHLNYLKEAMGACLPRVPVLGGIPREEAIQIPERHLGLVTADEIILDEYWRQKATSIMERHVDLDTLLTQVEYPAVEGMKLTAGLETTEELPASPSDALGASRVSIAVARDAAFCFYYQDNLELLADAGAAPVFFSPLAGDAIPEGVSGLYLGGGYPEVFAQKLSANRRFFNSLEQSAAMGMPIVAECGGLMVLGRFIETHEGERHTMVGLLPFGTRMLRQRKALGYTEVLFQRPCLLGPEGTVMRGHEFHYSEIIEAVEDPDLSFAYRIRKRKLELERQEGYMKGSMLASYVHLHWGSNPSAAVTFVEQCRKYRANQS